MYQSVMVYGITGMIPSSLLVLVYITLQNNVLHAKPYRHIKRCFFSCPDSIQSISDAYNIKGLVREYKNLYLKYLRLVK